MQTVAEGVEDAETLELLARFGVDFAQGYHIARPEPFAERPGDRSASLHLHTSLAWLGGSARVDSRQLIAGRRRG